ncbi:MAG: LPXTG cell wall anchor domain-containing protein [Nitriliruptorales bacterium]|nr:LPXTG cell wall anchor domain-containing protein [Nitriliruptorales bacterium]
MGASRRIFSGLLASLLALFMVASPAAAQEDYPPPEGSASGPAEVTQGEDATFTGEGFGADTEVEAEVNIDSEEGETFVLNETLTADAQGTVTLTFEVPCTVMSGDSGTVTFTGQDENGQSLTVSESFTVGGEAAGCPTGLPTTGSNITNGLLIAAAALILGIGFVLVARRRREGEHVEQS